VYDHIPRDCFIDMTDFSNWEELYGYLRGVTYERYCEYQHCIDEWIRSEKAIPFSNDHEIKQLYKLIEEAR
jgi:hypothetical protein